MSGPVCIQDFEQLAKAKLPKSAFDYFVSGSNEEQTLKDNCEAFKRYRFRPKILQNVSTIDTSTEVLGQKISFPLCVAPTAMNKMAHPDGELAVVRAACKTNIGYTLSTWATSSIEEVAHSSTTNSPRWMQLYIYKDRDLTKRLVEQAEKCGFTALFVTVDTPILGKRYQDIRNNFTLPPHLSLANIEVKDQNQIMDKSKGSALANHVKNLIDPTLTWSDITWLRGITKMKIIIKGVLTGEMAKESLKYGVDGIVVSNHGARQLDGVSATIDALQEVVAAVDGANCEVYLDGGVRNGNDIFKAVALGAKAVFIGRPYLWGLAYAGEEGVQKVLNLFKEEFESCMRLMGCHSLDEVRREKNLVVHESYFKSRL